MTNMLAEISSTHKTGKGEELKSTKLSCPVATVTKCHWLTGVKQYIVAPFSLGVQLANVGPPGALLLETLEERVYLRVLPIF